MKNYSTILAFFNLILLTQISLGQNTMMTFKGKSYHSTETMIFPLTVDPFFHGSILEVTIAKSASGGYIMLANETITVGSYLSGDIQIFLTDGTIITCVDRNVRDAVDDKSVSLYTLTKRELDLLGQTNISKIRFGIHEPAGKYYKTSSIKSYTANNVADSYKENSYPTSALVLMLELKQ